MAMDCESVLETLVTDFGPFMHLLRSVTHLDRNAHFAAGHPDTSLKNGPRLELLCHFPDRLRVLPILHHRRPRNHADLSDPRDSSYQLLSQPVRKIFVARIGAHVREGQ